MPTYSYACTHCDHTFDQRQSFTDDALTECPKCEGRLRKLFNAVGVVFKGSGFYRTDSRSGSSIPAGSSSSSSDGSGSASSGSSSTSSGAASESSSGSTSSSSSTSAGGAGGSTVAAKAS